MGTRPRRGGPALFACGGAAAEQRSLVRPEHGARVTGIGHSQADPQRGVGQHGISEHSGGPLGGEDQVDAERPSAGGDVAEEIMQRRMRGHERRVLVDHDDEPREVDLGDVAGAGVREHALSMPDLGAQTLDGAHGGRLVEIGEDPGDLRQRQQRIERAAALEVHEQERHMLWAVPAAERDDPGGQELALARSGHADHDRVRPVADEVQHGGPAEDRADRGREPRAVGRWGVLEERREPDRLLHGCRARLLPRRQEAPDLLRLSGGQRLDAHVATFPVVVESRRVDPGEAQYRRTARRWRSPGFDPDDRDVRRRGQCAGIARHAQDPP